MSLQNRQQPPLQADTLRIRESCPQDAPKRGPPPHLADERDDRVGALELLHRRADGIKDEILLAHARVLLQRNGEDTYSLRDVN